MFFARLKAAVTVLVVLAALLTALGFAIYFAHQEEEEQPEATPQTSLAAANQYVAHEGDSCWSIARRLTGVGSEENVRIFASVNSFAISQEARRRNIPYEECPIRAGEAYKVPAEWVARDFNVQTQTGEVDNDWPYWKGSVAMAIALGIFLGVASPWRLFRRKNDPSQLSLDWEQQEEQRQ